ncbi:GNAT family N-acetyltransferase, partial [Candidatus Pacearchaeota archaeon]|nr:GNAT family N-acetyltransferase [Candidatus Pacearchaeota archaeon]
MKLTTKRLILRDINSRDAKDIAENANDYDVWYFTDSIPHPYRLKDAKFFINLCKKEQKEKVRKSYNLGITIRGKNKVIGLMGLFHISKLHKKAEIGYWMGKKYRKQGIISEAEAAILKFGFGKLKLNKIHGKAMVENTGSNKLFEKFVFRKGGILKEELIKKGKKKDAY